jgi:hypothetical protein
MTDDLRRQDDLALAGIDKRLALLEQATTLGAKTAEARADAHDRQVAALGTKIDSAVALWHTIASEPQGSAAGRALLQDIGELKATVAAHELFIQQANGALRLTKFALGASLIAFAASLIQIITALTRVAP